MGGAIEATEYAIQNGGITGNMAGELTMRIVILAQDIVYSMTLPSVRNHAIDNLRLDKVAILGSRRTPR